MAYAMVSQKCSNQAYVRFVLLLNAYISSRLNSSSAIQVGDQILKVNDQAIHDTNHFFQLLRYAPPAAALLIIRDEKKAEELAARVNIPADRARYITRRDGFCYLVCFNGLL